MKKYLVIGNPIGHSLSPRLHNYWFKENNIDAIYEKKQVKENGSRGRSNLLKALELLCKDTVKSFKQVHYIFKQAHWLQSRFPKAELVDVEGLVKLVDMMEVEKNDWSLTPGRYVGVAPEVEDEDFDFEETLHNIHIELKDLNEEAIQLATQIQKNLEELGA